MVVVAVGSRNPVKVNAVRAAFAANWPDGAKDLVVTGHDVPSGVPDQPWGDEETRAGAMNRAMAAYEAHCVAAGATPDFAVGLEGGVVEEQLAAMHPSVKGLPESSVSCFAFMAVMTIASSGAPRWGLARTGSFTLPPRIVGLMRGTGGAPPMELGDADDAVFKTVNSKQAGGTVGKLTKGLIDRTVYYEHAMHLAIAPFLHDEADLYGPA